MVKKHMLRLFTVCLVLLAGIFISLANAGAEEERNVFFLGRTTEDAVKIRSGYNKNFGVLYSLKKDEPVVVCGKNFSWYKVMLPREVVCYVCADFVEQSTEEMGLIKANKVNIRSGPDTKFDIIGQGEKGEVIGIKGKEGNWYKIYPTGNTFGWVSEDYLENAGDAQAFLERRKSLDAFDRDFMTVEAEYQKCHDDIKSLETISEKINSLDSKYSVLSPDIAIRVKEKKDVVLQKIQSLSLAEEIREPKPKEENIIEVEGRIKELGKFWGKKGTHKLIKGFKTFFYLASEDLDLNRFLGYKVKVQGFLYPGEGKGLPFLKVTKVVLCE